MFACLAAAAPAVRAADASPSTVPDAAQKDFRRMYLFRFEFDNDAFLGKDNTFSDGSSFELHSPLDDAWSAGYAKWIGRVPGLGDDGRGGRVVRWAWGLSQLIVTPDNLSDPNPQPNDVPWAGILGVSASWSSYNNRRLAALQLFGGCMGPCSGAESTQKYVHNTLGFGESPEGWDNQLVNEALGNVYYEYRYKVFAAPADRYFTAGRFSQDFSVGGQAGAGNLLTFVGGQIEYRLGWGMPMGFTRSPDPPEYGIMLDPIYVDPVAPLPAETRAWRTYFTLVGRLAHIEYMQPAEGGETVNGDDHPPIHPYPGRRQMLVGFHLSRVPFAIHITYFRYFQETPEGVTGSSDWVNFSYEYRF
jgi:hypothetical protein